MTNRKAATAAALAGAVALASAAYGIGTQSGDGTAAAARDGTAQDRVPRLGEVAVDLDARFGDLAEELGVDADELRDALMDFHDQEHGERRDAFAAALAEALGKPVDEVRTALDEVRPEEGMRRGDGMGPGCAPHVSLRRLASELDVTRAELRQALRETRPQVDSWEDHRDDLAGFLADRFGISKEEVEEALPELPGPPRFRHGGPPPFGPGGLPD
jgi:Clp amino terminal domain, pathogenicity island component